MRREVSQEEPAWQMRPSQLPPVVRGQVLQDLPGTDHKWGVAVHRWQRGRSKHLLPVGVAALTAGGVTGVSWGVVAVIAGASSVPVWLEFGLATVFVALFVVLWGILAGGAALVGHLADRAMALALPPSAHYQATRDAFGSQSESIIGGEEPLLVVDAGGRFRGPSVALPAHGLTWRPSPQVARQLRAVSEVALPGGQGPASGQAQTESVAGGVGEEDDVLALPDVSGWSQAMRKDAVTAAVVAGESHGPHVARAVYNAVDAAVGFVDTLEDRAVRTPEAVWTLTKALQECREALAVFVAVPPDQAHTLLASGKTATQELTAVLEMVTAVCGEYSNAYRVDPADRLSALRRLNEDRYGKSGLDLD